MTLAQARQAADDARDAFLCALGPYSEWDWYRALNENGPGRYVPNPQLAANAAIKAAHDKWIKALHAFYLLRDGPGGVLGGRGC